MSPTWLEAGSVATLFGIFGYVVKSAISNKIYVRKDMCQLKHTWLETTLKRIEDKIDTLNGGSD